MFLKYKRIEILEQEIQLTKTMMGEEKVLWVEVMVSEHS